MAPGSSIKVKQSVYPADSLTSSSSQPYIEKDDTSQLSPKQQKLMKEFKNLPWFERRYGFKAPIVWRNIAVAIFAHLVGVYGVMVYAPKIKFASWILFLIVYLCSGLGVTAGAHRLWSHKSYKARLPFKVALMLFNCISMQNDLIEWCRDHRVHHKYTETDADPHNALRGFFFAHMGWLMMKKHPDIRSKGKNVDMSDLCADSVLLFQRRHYRKLCITISIVLPTVIPWLCWGEDIIGSYLILFVTRYILTLHSTWLVNSAAHLWGNRHYDGTINPRDNWFVCITSIGEGWHNYHHTFPYDYSTSEWGPKLNMTTIILDLMAALGLVYARKQVSQQAIDRVRKRLGNLSSSHSSIISHSTPSPLLSTS